MSWEIPAERFEPPAERSASGLVGRAGFAKVAITPPLAVELAGYGVYLDRRATEVHDELFVRALALEDDAGERVLLLSLDLVGLSWELSGAISAQAAAAADLDAERVLISCTHTHSGPAPLTLEGRGQMEPSYVESIPVRCATAAREAMAALHPVRIGTALSTVRTLGFNRVRAVGPIDRSLHMSVSTACPVRRRWSYSATVVIR